MLSWIIGGLGRLVLPGLVKVGVGEAAAGAFVGSKIFPALAIPLLLGSLYVAFLGVVKLHDAGLIKATQQTARHQCDLEHTNVQLTALQLENDVMRQANATHLETLRLRAETIVAFESAETARKEREDRDARERIEASAKAGRVGRSCMPDWLPVVQSGAAAGADRARARDSQHGAAHVPKAGPAHQR